MQYSSQNNSVLYTLRLQLPSGQTANIVQDSYKMGARVSLDQR